MNGGEMFSAGRASFSSGAESPLNSARPRRRLDPNAPAVENLARVIGAGATARLISTFGGGRVYIAKQPGPSDAVARVIGERAAGMLGAIFGGERIWLPNDAGHLTRRRISLMRQRGSSISRIARQLRLSERYVYKVLAQLRDG
jgi:Mor transcription activator family